MVDKNELHDCSWAFPSVMQSKVQSIVPRSALMYSKLATWIDDVPVLWVPTCNTDSRISSQIACFDSIQTRRERSRLVSMSKWMKGVCVWEEKGGGEERWVGRRRVALFTRHRQISPSWSGFLFLAIPTNKHTWHTPFRLHTTTLYVRSSIFKN